MIHTLDRIEAFAGPYPVRRVLTSADADLLHAATRKRQILPAHLQAQPPPIRQYMALDDGAPVGWAASIVAGSSTWCSNVFVKETHRRRGVAKSLLTRILLDDKENRAEASVLLASHAGARLYPTVGYEQIGQLLMFCPPRR
jgi:hypothetical protein